MLAILVLTTAFLVGTSFVAILVLTTAFLVGASYARDLGAGCLSCRSELCSRSC